MRVQLGPGGGLEEHQRILAQPEKSLGQGIFVIITVDCSSSAAVEPINGRHRV
jgi:hypothetical protein